MDEMHPLAGVYAAAVTPLKSDFTLDLDSVPALLRFLGTRGCHGVLLFGTTGEGPSFSRNERELLWRSAIEFRKEMPELRLLAGTGTPSLAESTELIRLALDLGYDGVVVLPPFYFRRTTSEGIFNWFSNLIKKSVPSDGFILAYHIPAVTGVGFSLDLLARLKDAFPIQFAGIKDSSHDLDFATQLGERFGRDLAVFNGTDSYFHHSLTHKAQGAITAPANLFSSTLRKIWDIFHAGGDPSEEQAFITEQRNFLEGYPPFPPTLKALLHHLHGFPKWNVMPPLENLSPNLTRELLDQFVESS